MYDASFVGDQFLREVKDTFHAIVRNAKRKNNDKSANSAPIPYLEQYYNVQKYYPTTADLKTNATSRILNAAMDALNEEFRLPRFLVIIIDKDLLGDFKNLEFGTTKSMAKMINWLVRQVDITVHRKKRQIEEKKPGAIGSVNDPTIIYVDMIKRPIFANMHEKLKQAMNLRFKFNRCLHETLEQQNNKVLTIRSCTTPDHFDSMGNLTSKGMIAFWHEVDDLLEHFDRGKVKLDPRLHNFSAPVVHKKSDFHYRSHHKYY